MAASRNVEKKKKSVGFLELDPMVDLEPGD
jgi:hypothetical protein